MRRIGLRNLFVTGIMVLMFATAANAEFITLTAILTGSQETPPNTSPGTGTGSFILDTSAGTLQSAVAFTNLSSPTILDDAGTSAHLHLGPPGVAGDIIRPYTEAPIGVTSGAFTDIWTGLTATDIGAIEAGNTYVNIHTAAFPAGEIRGQVVPAIPEPSSLVMGAIATLSGFGYVWRRHRRKRAVAL